MTDFFIVAVDQKWGIAKDNTIPWHYKEDFKFFKDKTLKKNLVMGFNTYKEIATMRGYPDKTCRLLPERNVWVISRNNKVIETHEIEEHSCDVENEYVEQFQDLDFLSTDNYSRHRHTPVVYVGGTSIYNHAMSDVFSGAAYGYVTRIKHDHGCNMFFNNELLEQNFELVQVIKETDDLRFEKWVRKNLDAWIYNKELQ